VKDFFKRRSPEALEIDGVEGDGRNGSASVTVPKASWGWECRLKGQIETNLPSVEDRTRGDYIPSVDKNQPRPSRPCRQRDSESPSKQSSQATEKGAQLRNGLIQISAPGKLDVQSRYCW
jgi:hypothetical protein